MADGGRPKPTTAGQSVPDGSRSLAPVAKRLSEIVLINKVTFAIDCVGPVVQKDLDDMHMGDILLLENLRFHREEETNDSEFCSSLLR